MGAVHGVYLKYVGLSAISFASYHFVVGSYGPLDPLPLTAAAFSMGDHARILATSSNGSGSVGSGLFPLMRAGTAAILSYSTLLNGSIAILFKLRRGMGLIGKNVEKGTIPWWSYALFFPFHVPTYAYTYLHTRNGTMKPLQQSSSASSSTVNKVPVPVATQVQPGWWVGGCYSHELHRQTPWAGIIDLTVEFPEYCRANTLRYLCLPTWDGVPCEPELLEKAALFCVEARENWEKEQQHQNQNNNHHNQQQQQHPDILIHCAHGRGRSTTVMCAAMVKLGLYSHWEEALEKGIRPNRPVCKLNTMMRKNLEEWQRIYVDGKKGI